jgi:L-ascorbate metabolism protein UlaG (beta-lactamase superfamily)
MCRTHPSSATALRRFFALTASLVIAQGCAPLIHPSLAPYRRYEQRHSTSGPVTARFLGTTSVLFQDASTTILGEGFVTRPGPLNVRFCCIAPDTVRIVRALHTLGINSIAAVFTGHAHYDHAMDAPTFAMRTGADLVGSSTLANIAWAYGLRDTARMRTIRHGDTVQYGKFTLTFLDSEHSHPDRFRGIVEAPLTDVPRRADEWKTGAMHSVLIQHGHRAILIQGADAFVPGALRGRHADVVYLSMANLGLRSDAYVDAYWNEVVRGTGAKRVIPVHWDNFFRSLDGPLRPMPTRNFHRGMQHILRRAAQDGVQVQMPVAWRPTDPFEGMPCPAGSHCVMTQPE